MAGASDDNHFDPQLFLSHGEQSLILAALASNNSGVKSGSYHPDVKQAGSVQQHSQLPMDNLHNMPFFASPQQGDPLTDMGLFSVDDSPFLDMLDGDTGFEFDNPDTSDLMIGSLPGDIQQQQAQQIQQSAQALATPGTARSPEQEGDSPEKRKSPGDGTEDKDTEESNKRRDPDEKVAKKPGRKPLTSEPTTKRKAQNRAAQRAFRERKEKHLKDLEVKVAELEKASDAANHENGLLRAQVQRLQTELREYRKRLSLYSSGLGRSPPLANGLPSYQPTGNPPTPSSFQFEFPRFGTLPGSHIFNSGHLGKSEASLTTPSPKSSVSNAAPGVLARQSSIGRSISPKSQNGIGASVNSPPKHAHSLGHSLQNTRNGVGGLDGRFGHTSVNGMPANSSMNNSNPQRNPSLENFPGQSRVFQFNSSSSTSSTDSPSASSQSHYGPNSSCGTSPEPANQSPVLGKANDNSMDIGKEGYVCNATSEGEITFCEKLNMACGNPRNPIPRAMSRIKSQSNGTSATAKTPAVDVPGIDWFANQNGGQFDPILLGDYREPQAAVVGDGDFTGGFFNDAFPQDLGSPFHLGDLNTPGFNKPNPMEEIERVQDGMEGDEEEVVPGEDTTQMLTCHKIWNKLQSNEKFKEGTIDIDSLCSELRAKARCSESGVVVDTKDVEAALKRLPEKNMPSM